MRQDINREVLEAYQALQQAMIDKDMATLDDIILDGTLFKHMSGKVQTKQEYLNEIKNGILNYYKYQIKDYNIDVVSDTEVILYTHTALTAKVYGMQGTWTLNTKMKFILQDHMWKMTH